MKGLQERQVYGRFSGYRIKVVSLFVEDKIQYGYNSVNKYEEGITAPG